MLHYQTNIVNFQVSDKCLLFFKPVLRMFLWSILLFLLASSEKRWLIFQHLALKISHYLLEPSS